jgi:hypothetical protein
MNSNQDTIFEWYDFLKYDLKPDKVNFNYIVRRQQIRKSSTSITRATRSSAQMIDDDSRTRDQEQLRRQSRFLQSRDRHLHARADREDAGNADRADDLLRGTAGA